MSINFDLAMKNNLNTEDLILISYIDLKLSEMNSSKGVINYNDILKDLPIIFNSRSEQVNVKKLRKMLSNENIKKFVTREIKQLGKAKGAITIFYINRENVDMLRVKGIVN
jgi:hypothetical protein